MLKEDNIYMENKTHPIIINEVKVKPMGMDENKDEYRNNLNYLNYTSYLLDDNNNIISVDDNVSFSFNKKMTFNSLYKLADSALYESKKSGRNKVTIVTE